MCLRSTDSWAAAGVSLKILCMTQSSINFERFPGAAGNGSRWDKSSSPDSQQGNLRPHAWIFLNELHTSEAFSPCDCSCSVLREERGFWLGRHFHRLLTGHAVTLVGRKHPISQEAEQKQERVPAHNSTTVQCLQITPHNLLGNDTGSPRCCYQISFFLLLSIRIAKNGSFYIRFLIKLKRRSGHFFGTFPYQLQRQREYRGLFWTAFLYS